MELPTPDLTLVVTLGDDRGRQFGHTRALGCGGLSQVALVFLPKIFQDIAFGSDAQKIGVYAEEEGNQGEGKEENEAQSSSRQRKTSTKRLLQPGAHLIR